MISRCLFIFLCRFGGLGTRKFALKELKQCRIVCFQTILVSCDYGWNDLILSKQRKRNAVATFVATNGFDWRCRYSLYFTSRIYIIYIRFLGTLCISPQGSILFIYASLYYYWSSTLAVLKPNTGWNDEHIIALKVLFHYDRSSGKRLSFSFDNWLVKATIIFICLVILIKTPS